MQKKFLGVALILTLIMSFMPSTEAKRFGDNYALEKVLILSRHNIRTPYIEKANPLSPHKWVKWSAPSRNLTLKGGLLETSLGQYFRKYLVDENFMEENYQPAEGEFRFYANARQRTLATAQYFSSGFLPVANVKVEYKPPFDKHDYTFNTKLLSCNDKMRVEAEKQYHELFGVDDFKNLASRLSSNLALMEKVLDLKDSPYARKTGNKTFRSDDTKFIFEKGKQPTFTGSIENAFTAADALILQYYETGTAFGRKLTDKQCLQIAEFNRLSTSMVAVPAVAANIAHPLLEVMHDELALDSRRFTFLCGHDTNISSVLGALGVEDYTLPDTIEPCTPIGVKFVIEKRRGSDGKDYAALNLVYMSTKQILNSEQLSLDNPPKVFPLKLKGLQVNADGLYLFDDVMNRFADALAQDYSARQAA